MVGKVRNWFSENFPTKTIVGQSEIWIAYNQFLEDLNTKLLEKYSNEEIEDMPIGDFIKFSTDWIKEFQE